MSSIVTFPLNDPGEGLTEAEIIELKVKVGDLSLIHISEPTRLL